MLNGKRWIAESLCAVTANTGAWFIGNIDLIGKCVQIGVGIITIGYIAYQWQKSINEKKKK